MGRNQTKTCNVCFKAMRSDVLTRHMRRHVRKLVNEDNVVTSRLYDGKTENGDNKQKISCSSEKFIGLEKRVIDLNKEFNRKIELGRNLKLFVDKHGFNENIFDIDMKEALQTYQLHGKE